MDKAKIVYARYWQRKTEEEKQILRHQIRVHKADKHKNENRNQRFWRLIRRREIRNKGYYNIYVEIRKYSGR